MDQEHQVWLNKRYQILDKIGEGGMGAVYKAHDRLIGTTVAIKRVTTAAANLMLNSRTDSTNFHIALAQEFKTLHSEASDLFAVGMMAYELVTGRHPFNTQSISDLIISPISSASLLPLNSVQKRIVA